MRTDDDLLAAALKRARSQTSMSLTFGGWIQRDPGAVLVLDQFDGSTNGALDGLRVHRREGLGGRVIASRRVHKVHDYLTTTTITQAYTDVVAREGLHAMMAVPVVVADKPVAALYGAMHQRGSFGDGAVDSLVDAARQLERDITERAASQAAREAAAEQVRTAYAELRQVARSTDDPVLRRRLTEIAEQLAFADKAANPVHFRLTDRELDVLGLVALGRSNAAIATELGLTVHTIKGYMKAITAKLGAANRVEAVTMARSAALLP